jgi:hypothetical protein
MAKVLFLCLAVATTTAAYDGAIYMFRSGQDLRKLHHGIMHEDVAKLIMEQRMKSTGYITLGNVEEPVVELLNDYGGEQEPLFSDETSNDIQQRLLII